MTIDRRRAIIIGVLFLVAAASYILVSEIGILSLAALAGNGSSGVNSLQFIADFAVQIQIASFNFTMLSLSIGSLFLMYALFVTRLVPRNLTIIGATGYLCLFVNIILGFFGVDRGIILLALGGIFGIALPVRPFAKCFNKLAEI